MSIASVFIVSLGKRRQFFVFACKEGHKNTPKAVYKCHHLLRDDFVLQKIVTTIVLLLGIFSILILCVGLLAANMLALRTEHRDIYRPLMFFFLAYGLTETQTIIEFFDHQRQYLLAHHLGMVVAVHCNLLLAPLLWLYVRAITASATTPVTLADWKHFLPLAFGSMLCMILMSTTVEFRDQIIGDSDLVQTGPAMTIIFAWILLMLVWVFQVFFYLYKIYRRLITYRDRLRNVFASTENLELRWIYIVVLLQVFSMFLTVPEMFYPVSENFEIASYVADFLAFWLLALWGLRQQPGLVNLGHAIVGESDDEKYRRSALSQEQMQRIASKIEAAMNEMHLYRNPNLTLRDLASEVSSPPNYVSQTLNSELGKTYFDYINEWRIEAAKESLLKDEGNVTEIALEVGFNSRSSFYKAFKRITGMTPTVFKNSVSQSATRS